YRAPSAAPADAFRPGMRVWVPFGRRRVVGVITEIRSKSEVPPNKLRSAFEVIDAEPTLDDPLLALLTWAADYYRHPMDEVIAAALPVPLRQGAPLVEIEKR